MRNAQLAIDANPALSKLNLEVLVDEPDRIQVRLPLGGNTNHFGAMYAGSLFSLAEFPFGLLFMRRFLDESMLAVVGEMTIRYLTPVTGDATVDVSVSPTEWDEMAAATAATGKHKLHRRTEVHDASGKVVCEVNATYFSLAVD